MFLASVSQTYSDIMTSVFSAPIVGKAWFATAAVILACVQVLTGARIFGKLERFVPIGRPTVNRVHRWSGRLAFLCTLPVAFHCIFILGFKTTSPRVVAHCILGSFVYGVFVVKVFFVHDRLHPRWVVPVMGGLMASVLAGLWATSALWYFTNVHFGF